MSNFLPYPSNNYRTYGSDSDLWATALTPAIINNNGFGISFEVTQNNTPGTACCFSLNGTGVWDLPELTVYYDNSTGILESQTSTSKNIQAYSYDGKMYVNNTSSEIIENANIQIYNLMGEQVYSQRKTIAPKEIENLTLDNPINGFYFITLTSEKNELIFSKKVFNGTK